MPNRDRWRVRAQRALFLWLVTFPLLAAGDNSDALAFKNLPLGSFVESSELRGIDGKKAPLLSTGPVNVFVFVRTSQEFSESALADLAKLQKKLAEKPIYWVAIVSDADPPKDVLAMVKKSGWKGPVLVDAKDALYGSFGVVLHPSLGIADKKHELFAYQPFRKVNFANTVEARIKRLLGEIDDAAMQRIIDPGALTTAGSSEVAQRDLKLAKMLVDLKKYEKALPWAQKAAEKAPDLAAAHGMLAKIRAAQHHCPEAEPAIERALSLDPKDGAALEARALCPAP